MITFQLNYTVDTTVDQSDEYNKSLVEDVIKNAVSDYMSTLDNSVLEDVVDYDIQFDDDAVVIYLKDGADTEKLSSNISEYSYCEEIEEFYGDIEDSNYYEEPHQRSRYVDVCVTFSDPAISESPLDEARNPLKNQLKKYQKWARKRQKGLPALSTLNPNAGNVEYNNAYFNHLMGDGNAPSGDATANSIGEGMKVKKELKEYLDDGWDSELADSEILGTLDKFIYEIRMGRRGAYTRAKSYVDLIDYVNNVLIPGLEDFNSTLEHLDTIESEEDYDDADYELEENLDTDELTRLDEIAMEMEDNGGKDNYIKILEKEIQEDTDFVAYLRGIEDPTGTNFDSLDDVDAAVEETMDRIVELKKRLNIVKNEH